MVTCALGLKLASSVCLQHPHQIPDEGIIKFCWYCIDLGILGCPTLGHRLNVEHLGMSHWLTCNQSRQCIGWQAQSWSFRRLLCLPLNRAVLTVLCSCIELRAWSFSHYDAWQELPCGMETGYWPPVVGWNQSLLGILGNQDCPAFSESFRVCFIC